MGHSLYLAWTATVEGVLLEARIQSDVDPPPAGLVPALPEHCRVGHTYVTRAMTGVPRAVCDAVARGYLAVMRATAEHGPPAAMAPEHAAAILGGLVTGVSRRRLRRMIARLGYGGGSGDLDLALGRAIRDLGGWPPPERPA